MEDFAKKYNMSEEELFSVMDHNALESEKVTAPRYSYWKSVFRVFFRNKINIIILTILAVLIIFAYVYPTIIGFDPEVDPFINVTNTASFHLDPKKAINLFGFELKWIFGTSGTGASTFNAIWNGSRISISLALICAAINMTIGIILGAVWSTTCWATSPPPRSSPCWS